MKKLFLLCLSVIAVCFLLLSCDTATSNPTDKPTGDGELVTEAHIHSFEFVKDSPATCMHGDQKIYACSCGETKIETFGEKTSHMFTYYISNNDATCSSAGTKSAVCDTCNQARDTITDTSATVPHSYTDWLSEDNVTMSRQCSVCDYVDIQSITETEHKFGMITYAPPGVVGESRYQCNDCKVIFKVCDVLKYTITDSEYDGKYCLTVEAKIPNVDFSAQELYTARPDLVVNCDGYYANEDSSLMYDSIAEIVIGDGIKSIEDLNYYNYVKRLTVGASVNYLGKNCISECYSLDEMYFLGDMPKIEPTSLFIRHVSLGDELKIWEPIIYYHDGAEGFENYKYKIQGCTLKKIGEGISAPTDMTLEEYSSQSVVAGMSIATDLFKRLKESDSFLHLTPYASIYKYKEIKDLALSLTEGLTTEREKSQKIFDWITKNISYDEKAMFYRGEKVFEEKIAVCNGYTTLMHDMLAAVGISSLYTHGITYADGLTVDQIINNNIAYLTSIMYSGKGHAWLTVYADGEVLICDPTWSNFDISPDEFAKTRITLGVCGISAIPEDIDPRCYEKVLYYDNGELYALNYGILSSSDGETSTYNFSFDISYRFHHPNDGYSLGDKHFEIKNAYHDVFINYGKSDYEWKMFMASDFSEHKYIDVLKFVAFENKYYGNNLRIEDMDDFVIDEDGHIYFILEDGSLCFAGTASQDSRLEIPAQVDGRTVSQIGVAAFSGSYASEIILPDTINYIYSHAFLDCGNLVSIRLPSSLTHMEIGVFAGCISLESVYLPTSIQVIGLPDNQRIYMPGYIFDGCDESTLTIYYDGTAEDFEKIHFNNPWGTEENGYTDIEQYVHVLKFVKFKD